MTIRVSSGLERAYAWDAIWAAWRILGAAWTGLIQSLSSRREIPIRRQGWQHDIERVDGENIGVAHWHELRRRTGPVVTQIEEVVGNLRTIGAWSLLLTLTPFLLDSKALSFLHGRGMKAKFQTQILWQSHAREALLHGGTVDSFVRPYHPDLRFSAFRAYIGAVRDALFRPRTTRRQSRRVS